MKIREWFARGTREKQAGVMVSVPLAHRISYFMGPIMEAFGGAWSRNIVAESRENVLKFSAVYACVSRIANDISILRPMVMTIDKGLWTEDESSPYAELLARPNPYMDWIQFAAYWMTAKLLYGNAYCIKDRDVPRGRVVALYPVDPRLAKPMVATDGEVYYSFSGDNLARIPNGEAALPASEVVHDRMNCLYHPLVGCGPLYAAASSATHGIRVQANSEAFFANMSRPSGHLSFNDASEEQLKLLKTQFESGFSGGNLGRLLVTAGGAKFEPMTIPAEQAQLIEQLKFDIEDIARAFSIPLHMIQAGTTPSFSNIAALNQNYLDQTLRMHIESVESLLTIGLELKRGKQAIQLDTESLLRMDPKTRAETMDTLVKAGILAPNEGRFRENLPPVTGGNSPMIQMQNFSLEALAKRDAKPDPFTTAPATESKSAPVIVNAAPPSGITLDIAPTLEDARKRGVGTYAKHMGGLVRVTDTGHDVIVNGIESTEVVQVNPREWSLVVKKTDGWSSRSAIHVPSTIYRGVFNLTKNPNGYHRGDMVTHKGHCWHCDAEWTVAAPGGNDDWTMAVRQGDRGRDAK